jgi:hypothetical protein
MTTTFPYGLGCLEGGDRGAVAGLDHGAAGELEPTVVVESAVVLRRRVVSPIDFILLSTIIILYTLNRCNDPLI